MSRRTDSKTTYAPQRFVSKNKPFCAFDFATKKVRLVSVSFFATIALSISTALAEDTSAPGFGCIPVSEKVLPKASQDCTDDKAKGALPFCGDIESVAGAVGKALQIATEMITGKDSKEKDLCTNLKSEKKKFEEQKKFNECKIAHCTQVVTAFQKSCQQKITENSLPVKNPPDQSKISEAKQVLTKVAAEVKGPVQTAQSELTKTVQAIGKVDGAIPQACNTPPPGNKPSSDSSQTAGQDDDPSTPPEEPNQPASAGGAPGGGPQNPFASPEKGEGDGGGDGGADKAADGNSGSSGSGGNNANNNPGGGNAAGDPNGGKDGTQPQPPMEEGCDVAGMDCGTAATSAAAIAAAVLAAKKLEEENKKKNEKPVQCGKWEDLTAPKCQDFLQCSCVSLDFNHNGQKSPKAGDTRTTCRAWAEDIACQRPASSSVTDQKNADVRNSAMPICRDLKMAQLCERDSKLQCPTCLQKSMQKNCGITGGAQGCGSTISESSLLEKCPSSLTCMKEDPKCETISRNVAAQNSGALALTPATPLPLKPAAVDCSSKLPKTTTSSTVPPLNKTTGK